MPASDAVRGTVVLGLPLLAALCFALAFPPIDLWVLVPLPPALLAIAAAHVARRGAGTRRLLAATAVGFGVAFLALDRWLMAVSVAGYPAKVAYSTAWPVLTAWILVLVLRRGVARRLGLPLGVALAWGGIEAFRGHVFLDGYPWYLLAHPLAEMPRLAQAADLLGATALSTGVALLGGLLAAAWIAGTTGARGRAAAHVAGALGLVAAAAGYGTWRLHESDASRTDGPTILALQTNLPQDNKIAWSFEAQAADFRAWAGATRAALADARARGIEPDLVAWPETMLPGAGLEASMLETEAARRVGWYPACAEAILGLQVELGVPFLGGSDAAEGIELVDRGDDVVSIDLTPRYNSAYLIADGTVAGRYDKVFLTPFGEVMPLISRWDWLEQRLLALGARGMRFSLSAAEDGAPLTVPARGPDRPAFTVATPICFEATVGPVVRRIAREPDGRVADVIVNLTNDGWFGRFDAGRRQHAQIARLRAIELRRPLVRVANTGHSVTIDAAGRLVDVVGSAGDAGGYGTPRIDGVLLTRVPLDDRTSPYARIGWLGPVLPLAGLAGVLGLALLAPSPRDPDGVPAE